MSDQSNSFSPYLPLFLLALAVLTSFGFQTLTLVNEAGHLKTAIEQQQPAIEDGQKVRTQLRELARQALAMAEQGNENAALLIETMRKKGVKIQADEAAPAEVDSP